MRMAAALLAALTLCVVFAGTILLLSPQPVAQPVDDSPAPTPVARASRTASPSPSPRETAPPPTPRSTPAPQDSNAPATPKPTPAPTPVPQTGSGNTLLVTVDGADYDQANVPSNGTVTEMAGGALRIETTRDYSDPLTIAYSLPDGSIPAGSRIGSIDAAVCGSGGGDFWEAYGPLGSDPFEYEVTPPSADGCWHFTDGSDDSTVLAITFLASWMVVERIEYTVTLGP